MKHAPYWLIEQVLHRQNSRDWSKLLEGMEHGQVKQLAGQCIDHLNVIDKNGTIDIRIKISEALTFVQLLKALGHGDIENAWQQQK